MTYAYVSSINNAVDINHDVWQLLIFRLHKLGIEAHAYAHYTSLLCFAFISWMIIVLSLLTSLLSCSLKIEFIYEWTIIGFPRHEVVVFTYWTMWECLSGRCDWSVASHVVVALSDVIIEVRTWYALLRLVAGGVRCVDVGCEEFEKRFVTVKWASLKQICTTQCVFSSFSLCQLLVGYLPLLRYDRNV